MSSIEGKLSLILPAHNEEGNLARVAGSSIEILSETVPDWEIVIVDDGSVDATPQIADELAEREPRVRVVHHPHNRGYGSAWRTGFETARGEYLMCMDSDGQFNLADISKLLPYINHYDIVAGYRGERKDPAYRKLNAAIFHLAIRLPFALHVRDLDCGFKIFKAEFIRSLPLSAPGALINLEIFSYAKQRRATIKQVVVSHYPRLAGKSSGASPRVVLQAMGEILLLRLRVWRMGFRLAAALRFVGGVGAGITLAGAIQRYLRRK